ncbi:beta family protein, partial [Pseudomonas aeruginosa]|uniref:beta family protein n=1 Tax=Pseudomonas aeruginosa TaxID=287 RepID=UPI0031B79F30
TTSFTLNCITLRTLKALSGLPMIKYVPFLKLKQNEIQSVGVLDGGIRDQIAPMYDIPRTQKVMDEAEVIDRLRIADKELGNARGKDIDYKFFVDNFDVDDSVDLGGVPQYRAVLTMLSNYRVMPVLAF